MKKIELLSPVGDYETLISAINALCDAVYLGGKSFGARKFAKNFDKEEMIRAIQYCHLYDVKIYVTVNTIIYDDEVKELINYIQFLYENGVDAVIMQDIGMIKLVHEIFPNLEIHASTQCHNYNIEGIDYLKELGVKRVVLARELSIDEIDKIDNEIEKEVFIHGALCVSFSGQCYFSSFNGGRSGNRGECVGCCRLPYKLLENDNYIPTDGNYLLSMKDLCSINTIKNLIKSGITSLKIEGRMKSPSYVYYVTKIYRKIIDNYYQNKDINITNEEIDNLKVLFNREFTNGYLNNEYGSNVMNIKSSNHKGIPLGKVINITNKKIAIKLDTYLNQNDGIRFETMNKGMIVNYLYDKKDNLINHANKNDIIYLDNKINLTTNNIQVSKTIDSKLLEPINSIRKVGITYNVVAKLNKKLEISITDGINEIHEFGNIINSSINNTTTKEDISKCLNKLGNTVFTCNNINYDIDNNIFIPLSELNNIRRTLVEKLIDKKKNNKKEIIINKEINISVKEKLTKTIAFLVRNEEQLKYLINKADIIYVTNINLYNKYKDISNVYFETPRATTNLINYEKQKLLITNLGALYKYSKSNVINSSIYLNITNYKSVNTLKNNNVNIVYLSRELKFNRVKSLINEYKNHYNNIPNLGIMIYGRIELMITKYCLSNMLINKDNKKCLLCKQNKYTLEDNSKNKYPIINNNCINYILDYKNIDELDMIESYQNIDINNFLISLSNEDTKQIDNILNKIKKD